VTYILRVPFFVGYPQGTIYYRRIFCVTSRRPEGASFWERGLTCGLVGGPANAGKACESRPR